MPRPNFLILYTDQQRGDALGAAGNAAIRTPALDALAARSARFDRCFSQSPVCMPSRASFWTGQYPSALGVQHMGVPLPKRTPTLPRLLRRHGYHSASFGKLHFLPHADRDWTSDYPDFGFDRLEVSDEPGCYEDDYRAWVRRVAPDQLPHISLGLPPAARVHMDVLQRDDGIAHPPGRERGEESGSRPFPGRDEVTHSAWVAGRAMEFIETAARGAAPFLLCASFFFPHSPWIVPRRFLDLYDPASLPVAPPAAGAGAADEARRRASVHGYYAAVSEVDHHVGRVLESLRRAGLEERTVVVFTSDHGEWLGEGGRFGKGFPGLDAVTRVPLLLHVPRSVDAAARAGVVGDLVESLDVAATLLDLAGAQRPPGVRGRSLAPYARGEAPPPRPSALTEHAGWRSLRMPECRYVLSDDGTERLLAPPEGGLDAPDLAGDPAHAGLLSRARREMARRLIEAEAPHARTWPY